MNYIVFDMEWNQPVGSRPLVTRPVMLKGEIIQIGAVKLNDSFERVDTLKVAIRPQYYKVLNPQVAKVTGLTTADLNCGYVFPYAMSYFRRFCGEEFAFMTWGCDDLPMLKDNMALHGLDTDWLPKCYNLQEIYDDQIGHEGVQCNLTKAALATGAEMLTAHDALYDALSTVNVLHKLDMVSGIANYREHLNRWSEAYPAQEGDERDFAERDDAIAETETASIVCPECGKEAPCREWAMQNASTALNVADCPDGHGTMVRIRFKHLRSGAWHTSRSLFAMDESREQFYAEKLEKYQKEQAEKAEWMAMRAPDGTWHF